MTTQIAFKDLDLIPEIQQALSHQNYTTATPIQAQSIPSLLAGRDLIGIAQTGTGKTAAFTVPILQMMRKGPTIHPTTLVLAPTRELAAQIGESFKKYGKFLKFKHTVIFGGVKQGQQVKTLSRGVDILVATPGRLLDLMNQGHVRIDQVKYFVLDEADRMLDMGFIRDIKKILPKLPRNRQSLFFSATMSPEVSRLASDMLKDPLRVEVTPQATTVDRIDQSVFFVDQKQKFELLSFLLKQEEMQSVLIFTRTKHRANKVATYLNKNGFPADAIHGNKSQNARTKAISGFKKGSIKALVATDIAARGIDIPLISHVINFELPNEAESYVHRIGRTARAGREGVAFSFCSADEKSFLNSIEKLTRQTLTVKRHMWHSDSAQNARGAAARPPKKQQGSFSRKPTGQKPFSKGKKEGKPRFSKRPEDKKKPFSKGKKEGKPRFSKRPEDQKKPFSKKPFGKKKSFSKRPQGQKKSFGRPKKFNRR